MIDGSYDRVRRPLEGRGLGLPNVVVFKAKLWWGLIALDHDNRVKGPASDEQFEALRDVFVGNLILGHGLSLTPTETATYQFAQAIVNASRPLGLKISHGKIKPASKT